MNVGKLFKGMYRKIRCLEMIGKHGFLKQTEEDDNRIGRWTVVLFAGCSLTACSFRPVVPTGCS
jgi:hypothetical protein